MIKPAWKRDARDDKAVWLHTRAMRELPKVMARKLTRQQRVALLMAEWREWSKLEDPD